MVFVSQKSSFRMYILRLLSEFFAGFSLFRVENVMPVKRERSLGFFFYLNNEADGYNVDTNVGIWWSV